MNSRIDLTLQILNKLGAPLMGAVIRAQDNGKDSVPPDKQAQALAALLANSVKVGLSLSDTLNLSDEPGSDAVRLALTGMASRLVGIHYARTGKPPTDAELKRLVTALEAVLSFADNFSPDADTILRLQAMDPETFLADEKQVTIQYINVLVPVVDAVSTYSFGRPESKLVQDVARRLLEDAGRLRQKFIDGAADDIARRSELQILKALADLYVQCHEEDKARLSKMDAKERATIESGGALPMDQLWENFAARVAMIEELGLSILPGASAGSGGTTPAAPVKQQAPSEQKPPEKPAAAPETPAVSESASQEQAPPPQEAAEETGSGEEEDTGTPPENPMSFFATKPDEDES